MMKKFCQRVALVPITLPLLFVCKTPAFSQDGGEDEFFLEEITVTAQKREENKQKTAITMDVITGEDVKQIGRKNLDDILSTLSSVTIKKSADGYRVAIRGVDDYIAPLQGMQITTPTVAVNTDGVYSNRNDAGSFFDLERVEVLYGPRAPCIRAPLRGEL
jgi:iron complex outermembrane receptor protein